MSPLPRILFIEDDASVIRAVERLCKNRAVLVVATTLEEARLAFPAGDWRTIFVDGCLNHEHKLDTLPLIRELRAAFPDLSIIACSGEPRNNKQMVGAGGTKGIEKWDIGQEINSLLTTG